MFRALTILAAVVALAVSASPVASAHASKTTAAQRGVVVLIGANDYGFAQRGSGIIMRDGGVCDPIRHMGC